MTAPQIHVMRDAEGRIIRIARGDEPAEHGWQPALTTDTDVIAFLRHIEATENDIAATDAGLARVTEDLINILIDKGLIQFTDLPVAAQTKLLTRRQARERMTGRLSLLDDDELL